MMICATTDSNSRMSLESRTRGGGDGTEDYTMTPCLDTLSLSPSVGHSGAFSPRFCNWNYFVCVALSCALHESAGTLKIQERLERVKRIVSLTVSLSLSIRETRSLSLLFGTQFLSLSLTQLLSDFLPGAFGDVSLSSFRRNRAITEGGGTFLRRLFSLSLSKERCN